MIIGLTGKKRTGKDTIANYLNLKYMVTNLALAGPLKEMCKVLFNWTDEHVYGNLKETIDPIWEVSPREVLQWFGTEVMQHMLPDRFSAYEKLIGRRHWVNLLISQMDITRDMFSSQKSIVITDIRFPHEVLGLQDYAEKKSTTFLVIRLNRNTGFTDTHPSETKIDDVFPDFELENNGTYEELYEKFNNYILPYVVSKELYLQ